MWYQICLADELLSSIGYGTYDLCTHPAKVSSKRRCPSLILSWERWGRGYSCDHLLLMMAIWWAQTGLTCLPTVTDIPSLWCWTWELRSTLITWERKDLWRAQDLQHYKSESRWAPAVIFQALPELLLKKFLNGLRYQLLLASWSHKCVKSISSVATYCCWLIGTV